jgi:hypothetical protein
MLDFRAHLADAKVMDRLIRDDDTAIYGDKGYASVVVSSGIGSRPSSRLQNARIDWIS